MRNENKIVAGVGIVWALSALLGLAFWGAVIYIVLHFVAKVW
jgi:hypothetical protein